MREFGEVDRLSAGAVGEPGDRTFFIEVGAAGETWWFLVEKEQLAVLARETIEAMRLEGLEAGGPGTELTPPGEAAFRVGEMRVGFADGRFRFVLIPSGDDGDDEPVEFEAGADLVGGMARRALEVVAAGRPRCPRCGLPEDPTGHVCPASNGDLRRSRR